MKGRIVLILFVLYSMSASLRAQPGFFDFDTPTVIELLQIKKMGDAYNYILFIGDKDSIYSVDLDSQKLPYEYVYQTLDDNEAFGKKLKDGEFTVQVDTSHNVVIPFYPDLPEGLPGNQIVDWIAANRKEVLAFPVYLWNSSNEITSIQVEGVTTSLLQEAKDEHGSWHPIEYQVNGFCGNGMFEYILKPGYFLITSVYKYSGNFCTELRVKFKRGTKLFYSNTFMGCINREQFAKDEFFNRPENFLEDTGFAEQLKCDTVYRVVDEMPMYKSSYKDLTDDLNKLSIIEGCPAEELQQVIWIIDNQGNIESVDVVGPTKERCKQNAIEHAKTLTDWKPGKLKGEPVCVKIVYGIHMRPKR